MRSTFLLGAACAALAPAAVHAQQAAPAPSSDQAAIVVTGRPFGGDSPTIVSKVDRETILHSGGGTIAGALAAIPGIAATDFAAGASRPIVRGMDATRVRMLEDGASSSDVSDIGPDHGVPIDPLAAQSIEVVRGAATLRYGSQAIGGVVNVLNNRVPLKLPTAPLSGELNASYGTAADTGELSGLADARVGQVALHADAFWRHAGDYDTPLGVQANSWFHGHGGSIGGSGFFGDSHVGAALIQYDANYGIPSDVSHIAMRQTKLITRDQIDLGSGALKSLDITGSYGNYRHDEVEPDGTIDTTFRNKEADARAELLFAPVGPFENSAIGTEVQRRRFSAIGEDGGYLLPTLTQSEAAYLFTDLPLTSTLRLQASGRVEHVRSDGTPRDGGFTRADFTPVSGAIGALLDATPALKFGFTLSSTGRAPAITELFARGPHDGPNTFETGDPTLRIERATSVEATARLHSGRLHAEGSLYSSWFRHYIFGDLTGRTCDDAGSCADNGTGDLRELNYRQDGAHFRGAEGEGTYDLVKGDSRTISARVLADLTRATLSSGGNVPRIPPYRIGGGIKLASRALDAGVLLLYNGRQTRFGAYDTPTPSYVDLGAQIAWRPFKEHPGVEVAAIGQNLTNDVQRAATALNRDEVVRPGRSLRLTLRIATS